MPTGRTTPKKDRPVATFDHLQKKTPMETVVSVPIDGEGSEVVEMRFRAIGNKRYDALIRAHPPVAQTKDQPEDMSGAPYNPQTFPVALVAASCVEPEMTEEQVTVLRDTWNVAEYSQLWVAALTVNTSRRQVVEAGKGSSGTRS